MQPLREQEETVELGEGLGDHGARLAHAGLADHVVAGERGRVPGGGRLALGGAAGLVEHDLLPVDDRLAHGTDEGQSVEVLEALRVDGERRQLRAVLEVVHQVSKGQVGLVADRDEVRGVEVGLLAQAGDHEGAALADEGGRAPAIPALLGQLLLGDEQGVVAAGVRDDPERVAAEEDRAAVALSVGLGDPAGERERLLLRALGFADPARDEQHRVREVAVDHPFHDARDLGGVDREHEEVHPARQRVEVRDAAHAVERVHARLDERDPAGIEAVGEDVAQDDPAVVHARGRGAYHADGRGVQQTVDLGDRPRRVGLRGQREAAHAVQRHHQELAEGEGVDFKLLDDVGLRGVGRRVVVGHGDERAEALDQLLVGHDALLAARQAGDLAVGERAAEELEEALPVAHRGGGGHDRLPLAEALGVEFRVGAADPGADHHAELARAADADDQLVAEGLGVRRQVLGHEDPADVACDGRPQRVAVQSVVGGRGVTDVALDPVRVALGHLDHHAAPGRADLLGCLGDDAHPAHLGLVHDRRGDHLEHDPLAGQRDQFLVGRARALGEQDRPRRGLGPGVLQEHIRLVLEEEAPALRRGGGEQARDGVEVDSQARGHWRHRKKAPSARVWSGCSTGPGRFPDGEGIGGGSGVQGSRPRESAVRVRGSGTQEARVVVFLPEP